LPVSGQFQAWWMKWILLSDGKRAN
jgi:hypothetical protein